MAPTAGTILRMKKAGVKPKKKTQSLKNKLRNLERFLNKDTLPEDVRKAKEEELAALRSQMDAKQKQDQEREIALKYRKVKFFERRRLMRTLKKLRHEMTSNDSEELKKQYEAAKQDMMYIFYYPKGEKYVQLFPDKKKQSDDDLARQAELKKAAIHAYTTAPSHADFDNYCFCDAKEPAEDSENETKGQSMKRKPTDSKHKEKRRKKTTDVHVVADTEAPADAQEEDDFFM